MLNCHLILRELRDNKTRHRVVLSQNADTTELKIDSEIVVVENKHYDITLVFEDFSQAEIYSADLYLNDEYIGSTSHISIDNNEYLFRGRLLDSNLPFHMQYDMLQLSVKLDYGNDESQWLHSLYILCKTKYHSDAKNVNNILLDLLEDNNLVVNDWMLPNNEYSTNPHSLLNAGYNDKKYKSVSAYINLLNDVVKVYNEQISAFHYNAFSRLENKPTISTYDKVKKISFKDVNWLFRNTSSLSRVRSASINLQGKAYLPHKMQHTVSKSQYATYENVSILSFIDYVHYFIRKVTSELYSSIGDIRVFVEKFTQYESSDYKIPILTIKRAQICRAESILSTLNELTYKLASVFRTYKELLKCVPHKHFSWPRSTKIFQEIPHYNKVFKLIEKWRLSGEFTLSKESLILRTRRFDKLYEFYCLSKLLEMFKIKGFAIQFNSNSHFVYPSSGRYIDEDFDIANTYYLKSKDSNIVIFYQPYIYSNNLQNGITLFKTSGNDSFRPDFVIKFFKTGYESSAQYAILDAKYSNYNNVIKYSLPQIVYKYGTQILNFNDKISSIRMIWILHGRQNEDASVSKIYKLHTSPLMSKINHHQSIGTYPLSSMWDFDLDVLWNLFSDQFDMLSISV